MKEAAMTRFLLSGFALLSVASVAAAAPDVLQLEIAFSDKAASRLQATGEGVSVLASFYGAPTAAGEAHLNDIGYVDLGTDLLTFVERPAHVRVSGQFLSERVRRLVVEPQVNVNLFSARRASDDNILACDVVDTAFDRAVREAPIRLRCSLLEEGREIEVRP